MTLDQRKDQQTRRNNRVAAGLCEYGDGNPLSDSTRRCAECREKSKKWYHRYNAANPHKRKAWRDAQFQSILDYYGATCACCGENDTHFLTIDHINNDGNKHRMEIGGGGAIVRWLIANQFPPGFQLLCYNCNMGKAHHGGTCPHQSTRLTLVACA